jgi:hypothetical protein
MPLPVLISLLPILTLHVRTKFQVPGFKKAKSNTFKAQAAAVLDI